MNRGFTLIEIIITIVVLAIVSLFTFSFINTSAKTYQMVKTQNGLYFEAAYALERISRELNDATYVISSSSNSIVFQKVNYSTTIDNRQFVDYPERNGYYTCILDCFTSSGWPGNSEQCICFFYYACRNPGEHIVQYYHYSFEG